MQKKKSRPVLPSGGLFLELNSSLSSPTSEQVCQNRGGGEQRRYIPGNRVTDRLKGLQVSDWVNLVWDFVLFILLSSFKSLVTYPLTKR